MFRKLRVGIVTSSLLVKTGFSNNAKAILPYLYNTGKYELFHLNQGMVDSPEFQRFPWHNEGALKNGTFDVSRFQSQDEGYRQFISYGNGAIEKFVINNKLDVVIHIEDVWSSRKETYLDSKWFPYLRENFLQWSTADSLPILQDFKIWAEKCPNIWFWASFAERALKNEDIKKYGHVKTVPGCFDTKEYHPILKHERRELRKRNNIDQDTLLFFQLGRAQLRKLYPCTLESFGKFKKRSPKVKAKLLFHCSASEGWPFQMLIKENDLENSDVLFTHFCLNCGAWEVKPFQGEFKDCRFCGVKGEPQSQQNPRGNGQKTAGIDSSISNEEMSNIFGICDASVSPFTSGGYERFNAESLLCELPLLCSEYSAGEDFIAEDFVFPLDGTFTYESGTGFRKHVPNINTMIKFYEKIASMSLEERKEIGRKGRKWAMERFDVSVIAPILENWLDTRKPLDWDFTYHIEAKDPNAQVENFDSNSDFIKECYRKILKMEVRDDDSGKLYWEGFLSTPGKTRDDLIKYFRSVAYQENQQNQKSSLEDILDKNDYGKRILFCIPESAGDVFLNTSLFKSLKEQYPWANLYVATKQEYFELLEGNPYIFKVIPFIPELENQLAMEGHGEHKGYFEIAFFPHYGLQRNLDYLHNERTNIAFNNKY